MAVLIMSGAAAAELLNGAVIFNSQEARVMGLRTADGLTALAHGTGMKLSGIQSLDKLKPCDEISVEVAASGPARVIGSLVFKKGGRPEECAFPTAPTVTIPEFYRALQDKTAVVYDVRTPEEFSTAHFEGAINLPLPEVAGRLKEFPTDTPIILYCASAKRSAYASVILRQNGITSSIVKGRFIVKDGRPQMAGP